MMLIPENVSFIIFGSPAAGKIASCLNDPGLPVLLNRHSTKATVAEPKL